MAITRGKKEEIVAHLEGARASAKSVVFANFNKLPVGEVTQIRNKLRSLGVGYFVAKRTLIERAFKGAYQGDFPSLDGHQVAVVYGAEDEIAPAQNVLAFSKEYKDRIGILGGVFEGSFKNKAEMNEIASIPPLQVLRGMFVNVINSPIQGLVIALDAIAEKKS